MRAHERYRFIYANCKRWTVKYLCSILEVSESGYYRFASNLDKPSKEQTLSAAMRKIINSWPYNDNYGVIRMQLALNQQGIKAGIRRITRLMRENCWLHKRHRRPYGLTKATTEIQEKENLIKQDFSAERPLQKLLTDISQIQCRDGKLYISPIMDCFNGEILALCMRNNMRKELCIDTFNAVSCRYRIKGAVFHSDRGSQYTSDAFRKTLADNGVIQSLSGVHHCFDNARMESFFATLKKELLYRIPTYRMSMETVKHEIFKYVFTYYNLARIYTANPGGLPPAAYRRSLEKEQLAAA